GAEGDLHRLGELVDAALEGCARVTGELEVLGSHGIGSLYRDGREASVVRSGGRVPLGAGWRVRRRRSEQDGEDVVLAQDEKRLAVYDDFGAAVFPKEDSVADLDIHRDALAFVEAARADGENLALLRLLLGGVGD